MYSIKPESNPDFVLKTAPGITLSHPTKEAFVLSLILPRAFLLNVQWTLYSLETKHFDFLVIALITVASS